MKKHILLAFFVIVYLPMLAQWDINGNNIAPTNWLGTLNNQPLDIRTAASPRLFITATGDIGINTTTPLSLLHGANGNLLFSSVNLPASVPLTATTVPITGAGIRLMWIEEVGAFRAGTDV